MTAPRPLPTPRPAAFFAWLLALLLALGLPAPSGAKVLEIRQAQAVESDGARFPEDAPRRLVTLPDVWQESRPGYSGTVWYRMQFDAPGAADLEGLYAVQVERACSNFEAWVNGQLVFREGRLADPVTRNCYRPQQFTLPATLLKGTGNTLELKVAGYALESVTSRERAAGLSTIEVGPLQEMGSPHGGLMFWQITLPQIITGTMLLLGGFTLMLGLINRQTPHLKYFGCLCLSWTLMTSRPWSGDLNLPNHMAELLMSSMVPLVVFFAVQFLLRYARWQHRAIDLALGVQCLTVPASLMLADPQRLFGIATAWYTVLTLEALAAVGWYLWLTWRRLHADFVPMAVLLSLVVAVVGVEFAAQQGHLVELRQQLAPIAMPLLFALIGARLLWQHARALQLAETSQRSLESRIREATVEMERSFKMMAEMRVEQVTQQERKRIAADLHDDLGAKLLTIVHTSDNDRISTLAREALEEMRLSVRGLTGKPVRLADALGDWRAEVVLRLSQAGVEGEWHAPNEDELPQMLAARAYVQTTRILREAVSNIIKHSDASHCTVASQVLEGDFQLIIQDNGRGIPLELDGKLDRGHGMASMKHRAKQLHGQCLVESGPGYGTVIRLTIPLERHVTPA